MKELIFMEFLSSISGYILPFLAILTLIVFIHEMGHYLVARWNKVDIEAFSIGFGPELFGFYDKHHTRWKFCAIPLGGYVKFLGDANAASVPDFNKSESLTEEEKAGRFENKTVGQRAAIVAAGPIANFILAIFIFAGSYYFLGRTVSDPVVTGVQEESAAQKSGIKEGDLIVAIDGTPIEVFSDIPKIVMPNHGIELTFTVKRDGKNLDIPVTPTLTEQEDRFGNKFKVGLIGVTSDRREANERKVTFTLWESVQGGVDDTVYIVKRTFQFIGGLFTGREDPRQLSGPAGMAKAAGDFYQLGIPQLIYLAGLFSVSIGLLNLFPIPILDGGHLVFYGLEALRGKPVSEKIQEYAFRVGFILLICLMIFATNNDIMNNIG